MEIIQQLGVDTSVFAQSQLGDQKIIINHLISFKIKELFANFTGNDLIYNSPSTI